MVTRKMDDAKKKKATKGEKKKKKKDGKKPDSKDDEEGGEDGKDGSHPKLKKSDAGVGVSKHNLSLPLTCTHAYLDWYDIVDDDPPKGKRYVNCRKKIMRTQALVQTLQLTFQTMRNILLNGTNGRRLRRVMVPKPRGAEKYVTLRQVQSLNHSTRFGYAERDNGDQEWQMCQCYQLQERRSRR